MLRGRLFFFSQLNPCEMNENKKSGTGKNNIPTRENSEKGKMNLPGTSSTVQNGQVRKNIESVMRLEKEATRNRSIGEHVADKVTAFAGSTPFIGFHIVLFGGWILINTGLIPGIRRFDPFPF